MAISSQKKILNLRKKTASFYHPIRFLTEVIHFLFWFFIPYVRQTEWYLGQTSGEFRFKLATSACLTLFTHFSFAGILDSAEGTLSGSASNKWNRSAVHSSTKKVPGSEEIDFFFLFCSCKAFTGFLDFQVFYAAWLAMLLYGAWKGWNMYKAGKAVYSGFTGKNATPSAADGEPVPEGLEGMDRKERRKELRRREREAQQED